MEPRRTVFFDFDGVIADSFQAGASTAKKHCSHKTEEIYRQMFEGNIYEAHRPQDDASLDHSQCDHNLDWWETFKSFFDENNALFAEMDSIVKRLAQDYRLVIVSSSRHEIISSFLQTHGLESCFEEIMDMEMHRSKSEKLALALKKYNITPRDCVMVTDSKGDVLEAREQGVECVAVTWGFNSHDVLASAEPFRIVHVPSELPNAVTEFFHGKGTSA